ncbi:YagU family protein [Pasteurella bettyae]|uniref:PF07274 family protein n=1 Tax=Pasteurella bettyae CCUG 2042 TaxID=1095749 RepID=I3DBC5_9PAST|nr:DUF1440 domain-containing protein [Pasteurella bettyae]EIJ69018.1 PF07274 family protein [Pasteurella bettyae CCUG 2042]SUB22807.1 Inner membrane protein yagU [Pasteurella bettyae]
MSGLFEQTPANRRRYGLAVFIGIIGGIISAFVKWGAEHPFPPRSPIDLFSAACPQPVLDALNSGSIVMDQALQQCSRAFLNPPHVFLRDYMGIDPTEAVFTFADYAFNWIGVTHIIFSIVFAVGYGLVAEVFPKIKFWQGIGAGLIACVVVHYIVFPAMGLAPAVAEWPWYEHVSEILGHIFWFWTIEVIRRDLRNRITHEPDPEVSLNQAYR